MADVDVSSALPLEPGERVLWEGRPGFGAPWHEVRKILQTGFLVWTVGVGLWSLFVLVPILLGLAAGRGEEGAGVAVALATLGVAVWWAVMLTPFVGAFVLARVVGPYLVSLLVLGVFGPMFVLEWLWRVSRHGWEGALARFDAESLCWFTLLVGLPLLRIAVGVAGRLNLLYVVTDRRAAALRTGAAGARLLWTAPLVEGKRLTARVVWPWRSRRRGHLAVGFGPRRRDVAMIRHPDEVLAIVRRAVGEEVEGVVPRRRRREQAPAPAPPEQTAP